MAQIRVRDQSGNPIKLLNVRLSLGTGTSDQAYDDRFTDLAGNTAWPNPLPSNNGYTLYANYANINPNYNQVSKFVTTLDADIDLVLQAVSQPSNCPNPNDKNAVHDWFFGLANSVQAFTNTESNRQRMIPDFTKCQVAWQNQNRPPMRARFFLNASGPNLDSSFIVDTGDENSPFNLTFRY